MTVNFTGIKNVGSMNVIMPGTNRQMCILSAQLTNDEEGNDLDEFKKAIEKTSKPEKYLTAYDGVVSVNVSSDIPEEEYERPTFDYYLNGSDLEVNDENLPVYTYLAKMTRKIAAKKDNTLGMDPDFVGSKDFLNGTALGYFVKQAFAANPSASLLPLIKSMFIPENARQGAHVVNRAINETMTDYLC